MNVSKYTSFLFSLEIANIFIKTSNWRVRLEAFILGEKQEQHDNMKRFLNFVKGTQVIK